jgi:hypothetical protein
MRLQICRHRRSTLMLLSLLMNVYKTYIFNLSVGCGWLELKEHDVENRHRVVSCDNQSRFVD